MRHKRDATDFLYPGLTIVLLVAGWEALTRLGAAPAYALPTPGEVGRALMQQWPLLLVNTISTAIAIVAGFALSVVGGIALAVLISSSRVFEKSLYPLLVGSQAIPKLALAPLFVVWFGFGMLPKIIMTFLIAGVPHRGEYGARHCFGRNGA